MLLTVSNLSQMYGHIQVLQDVSFVINEGDRIGLVGANGAGKSTLLKIIMGEVACDSGSAVWAAGVEPGYIPQTIVPSSNQTLADLLNEAQQGLLALEQRMDELTRRMAGTNGDEQAAVMAEYGEIATRFEQAGGYDMEHRVARVLEGLHLAHLPHHRHLAALSGGERARVALAALLLRSPHVLLLDEPTSHLDQSAAEWLEAYLIQHQGAVLAVSHDRQFLNRIATRILELDEYTHRVKVYVGSYDAYAVQKQQEREQWEEDYASQQEEIKELQRAIHTTPQRLAQKKSPRDNDKMGYNFFGERVQRATSRSIRAAEQALEELRAEPIPRPPGLLRFRPAFQSNELYGNIALEATDIYKVFADGRVVLDSVQCEIGATSRIVLVGENGAGKTTLLRILAGKLLPDKGTVVYASGVATGYLEQEVTPEQPEQTLLQAYRAERQGSEQEHLAELLRYGLFRYEETTRRLRDLSAGQYRKLQLARLIASGANVLLLDEPTNYLSLDVLEQFERALHDFPGAVVAVSHDRWFIQQFAGEVWQLERGQLFRE